MSAMASLIAACIAFVGSHLLLSHPLRAPLIARLGQGIFMGLYVLVAFATLGWAVMAFRAVPPEAPLWFAGDIVWALVTLVMWAASILFIGSLSSNPALPDPRAGVNATRQAQGVYAVTRHPMMWSFILWGLCHIVVMPTAANALLAGSMVFLAFFGALGQDGKKVRQMGTNWQGWQGRTSFLPFHQMVAGKARLADAIPGWGTLSLGTLFWLGVTWAHGGIGAGIWRWISP